MRLFLSSFRLGDHAGELAALAGAGARAVVIANALDNIPADSRTAYARNIYCPLAALRELGLEAADLDLRRFFGDPTGLEAALEGVDLVWCAGGNAFLLRRAMRESGFDRVVPRLLAQDRLVYAGDSAGACVAGPSLRGLDLMDQPHDVADGYPPEPVWEGLGLIDVALVPHYRSDHAEAAAAEACVAWMRRQGQSFEPLCDGEVMIVDGGRRELRRRAC